MPSAAALYRQQQRRTAQRGGGQAAQVRNRKCKSMGLPGALDSAPTDHSSTNRLCHQPAARALTRCPAGIWTAVGTRQFSYRPVPVAPNAPWPVARAAPARVSSRECRAPALMQATGSATASSSLGCGGFGWEWGCPQLTEDWNGLARWALALARKPCRWGEWQSPAIAACSGTVFARPQHYCRQSAAHTGAQQLLVSEGKQRVHLPTPDPSALPGARCAWCRRPADRRCSGPTHIRPPPG